MHFARIALQAPDDKLAELAAFYATRFAAERDGELRIGETALVFAGTGGAPFYHFAFLVPGDRFDAALEWAESRLELLPDRERGHVVYDFDFWNAHAFYLRDPAGNIVELIAHHGTAETGASGVFDPSELVGLSEIGLIGDSRELAGGLEGIGVRLWDGAVAAGGLAFLGEKSRTLIVAEPGRGWLPTGRPAEVHPVDLVIAGLPAAEATVGGHHIRCRPESG